MLGWLVVHGSWVNQILLSGHILHTLSKVSLESRAWSLLANCSPCGRTRGRKLKHSIYFHQPKYTLYNTHLVTINIETSVLQRSPNLTNSQNLHNLYTSACAVLFFASQPASAMSFRHQQGHRHKVCTGYSIQEQVLVCPIWRHWKLLSVVNYVTPKALPNQNRVRLEMECPYHGICTVLVLIAKNVALAPTNPAICFAEPD